MFKMAWDWIEECKVDSVCKWLKVWLKVEIHEGNLLNSVEGIKGMKMEIEWSFWERRLNTKSGEVAERK